MPLLIDEFDYELPPGLIAQLPAPERSSSRLLRAAGSALSDHTFSELPSLVSPGDLLVLNDTRVIKARLHGEKETGGRVELLVERVLSEHEALVQIGASKPTRSGAVLHLAGGARATVIGRSGEFHHVRLGSGTGMEALLQRHGAVPLPPYIDHGPDADDERRYQTVYARAPGAVAAPTAGLHFDEPLLARLRSRGVAVAFVTLHVGAGTFQPVRVRELSQHRMHAERYEIPPATVQALRGARERGGRVIAVGTTTVRCLEASAARHGAPAAETAQTDLFIAPGFPFRVVDRLITNFHLPRSSLLVLVSAFAGTENVRAAYRHAIEQRYRFYSYGDAMLVDRL